MFYCNFFLLIILSTKVTSNDLMKVIFTWQHLPFVFEDGEEEKISPNQTDFDSHWFYPFDFDVPKDKKLLVTIPRTKGVPATVADVLVYSTGGGRLLEKFINWDWYNMSGSCNNTIFNPHYSAVDECNRYWIMDNGDVEKKCPPKLLAFDASDKLIQIIEVGQENGKSPLSNKEGLITSFVVETDGQNCEKTHIYMGDVKACELVIWNNEKVWRLNSPLFEAQEKYKNLTINGDNFELGWGIGAFSLTPKQSGKDRKLYFRSISSVDIVSVFTSQLHDSFDNANSVQYDVVKNVLPSPTIAMAFSKDGTLFFGLTKEQAIGCWNMNKPLTPENIIQVHQNSSIYRFVSGVKIIPSEFTKEKKSDKLYVLSNNYGKTVLETKKDKDDNYHLIAGDVDELIKKCRLPDPPSTETTVKQQSKLSKSSNSSNSLCEIITNITIKSLDYGFNLWEKFIKSLNKQTLDNKK